jgi:hypothetical protein
MNIRTFLLLLAGVLGQSQPSALAQAKAADSSAAVSGAAPASGQQNAPVVSGALGGFQGKTVTAIDFAGVDRAALSPLPDELAQQPGEPLDPQKFATVCAACLLPASTTQLTWKAKLTAPVSG